MAKNVVVTVDDYLMRKDPEKYKKLLGKEEEKEEEVKVEDDTEKRELLNEIETLEIRNSGFQIDIEKAETKIKASYATNVKLGKENKKLKAEVNRLKGKL